LGLKLEREEGSVDGDFLEDEDELLLVVGLNEKERPERRLIEDLEEDCC